MDITVVDIEDPVAIEKNRRATAMFPR